MWSQQTSSEIVEGCRLEDGTPLLVLDIETFSSIDLKKTTVYKYAESPDFEILMCAWSNDGVNVNLAVGEDEVKAIPGLFDPSIIKVAHNAQFERVCFSALAGERYLSPEQFLCTMVLAAEAGLPRSLKQLAIALGAEEKDEAGTRLINLFSKPLKGKRRYPKDRPEEWEEFKAYCVQDVRTLLDILKHLPHWPTQTERQLYVVDQLINDRGILVDYDMAVKAVEAAEDNKAQQLQEAVDLTGLDNPNSTAQLLGWLQESGLKINDLKAETVKKALTKELEPEQRRVLELRQDLAMTASKKFTAAKLATCEDSRFRGGFAFYGAHTGRWSGRGVQLHNLPRQSVDYVEAAIFDLKSGLGADPQTLKGLIRPLFVGPFTVVDYSAIEARVIAWLAGEQWALDAFRAHRDIYVETAKRMGGLTRFQGKVAVLALGFGGSVGSLRHMGGPELGTDEELQAMVYQWRDANKRIVRLWHALDSAFYDPPKPAGRLAIESHGRNIHMVLPSGRALVYNDVETKGSISFSDPRGFRTTTYGGKLGENATQAVARDVLAEALIRLEEAGFRVVGHVHDEVIVESEDVDAITKIVCQPPDWAPDLPIDAEGATYERYQK